MRSSKAFYEVLDNFSKNQIKVEEFSEEKPPKVIYPFYQYGDYEKYDPENAQYYIPGSSIKGALKTQQDKLAQNSIFMADDIPVENENIVLRNLYKLQTLKDSQKQEFKEFFENTGIEMIKAGVNLQGELYAKEDSIINKVLEFAKKTTRHKIGQMIDKLTFLKKDSKEEKVSSILETVLGNLSLMQKANDIILLGGYKGLLHSVDFSEIEAKFQKDLNKEDSGIYIDKETMLPHGLLRINLL